MKRSIYISRKVLSSGEIRDWCKQQGFVSCLPDTDLHVTVAFDYKKHDWAKLPLNSPEHVEVLGVKPVAEFRRGAIVLTLECPRLQSRWEQLCEWGLRWRFKDYRPHITLTYNLPEHINVENIVPYTGVVVLGPEVLVEVSNTPQHTIDESPLI